MNSTQTIASLLYMTPLLALISQVMIGRKSIYIFLPLLFIESILLFAYYEKPFVLSFGSWDAHYAINLMIDRLTCLMLCVFTAMSCIIVLFGDKASRLRHPMGTLLLLYGVMGATATVDIFNCYVWFEVMLLSAFILLSDLERKSLYVYALMNITGTMLMLLGIAMIYGITGSLNTLVIASAFASTPVPGTATIILLFLLGICVKAAAFPGYFWLPTCYAQSDSHPTLLLASTTTKVSMVVLLRLAWYWQPLHSLPIQSVFITIACITMLFGVLGAANQMSMRSILSFHIVSQLGYILLTLFLKVPMAIVASLYFLIHNIIVKTNLMMVSRVIERQVQHTPLKQFALLARQNPMLNVIFLVSAFSLAGFPPLSGFWAKLFVFQSGLQSEHWLALFIALFVGSFTLYSMVKLWRYGFCQSADFGDIQLSVMRHEWIAMWLLLGVIIILGCFPDLLIHQSRLISAELTHVAVEGSLLS